MSVIEIKMSQDVLSFEYFSTGRPLYWILR